MTNGHLPLSTGTASHQTRTVAYEPKTKAIKQNSPHSLPKLVSLGGLPSWKIPSQTMQQQHPFLFSRITTFYLLPTCPFFLTSNPDGLNLSMQWETRDAFTIIGGTQTIRDDTILGSTLQQGDYLAPASDMPFLNSNTDGLNLPVPCETRDAFATEGTQIIHDCTIVESTIPQNAKK